MKTEQITLTQSEYDAALVTLTRVLRNDFTAPQLKAMYKEIEPRLAKGFPNGSRPTCASEYAEALVKHYFRRNAFPLAQDENAPLRELRALLALEMKGMLRRVQEVRERCDNDLLSRIVCSSSVMDAAVNEVALSFLWRYIENGVGDVLHTDVTNDIDALLNALQAVVKITDQFVTSNTNRIVSYATHCATSPRSGTHATEEALVAQALVRVNEVLRSCGSYAQALHDRMPELFAARHEQARIIRDAATSSHTSSALCALVRAYVTVAYAKPNMSPVAC